jgi:formylglycine-generating enzyme required for sulfatase activity/predicted Ser/Thr protein kinase
LPLSLGEILNGRYRIEKQLGKGGFGAVYQSWDTHLNEPVALKESLLFSPEAQRQFQQEAKMLFKLRHPNLPVVHDCFIIPGQGQYLVMDFIEGENLGALVKHTGALPVEQALKWIRQAGEALSYLHTRQPPIIHRDIKPANIILTLEGRIFLVDFGIAKEGDIEQVTMSGAHAKSPGYSPPEQYGQTGTDAQSDLYALGATSYTLLTGRVPEDAILLTLQEKEPMPPAHQVNPKVPVGVSRAIEAAMRLKRSERTRSVAEFLAGLHEPAQPVVTQPLPPPLLKQTPVVEFAKPAPKPEAPPERIPKIRTNKFIEPDLVSIPAGEFWMGSDRKKDTQAYDEELTQHRLSLPEFRIGKYPVTNEEYRLFLLANPQQKKTGGWYGSDSPSGKERHPVVNVDWHDALAYCRWLSEMTGKSYLLPSEAEWEKAARGTDGRIYPWGNQWNADYCNTSEKGPGYTTPVGKSSPEGDSPYGCADMAGNVWEWTRSLWGKEYQKPDFKYPYKPDRERENLEAPESILRVLRGGSFLILARFARCAYRLRLNPNLRNYYIGFRVVVSPFFFPNSGR